MANETPKPTNDQEPVENDTLENETLENEPEDGTQEPFIPPQYMLIVAAIGLIVALVVLTTQASFTIVGWGGLGLTVLALIGWAVMAPDQAKAVLTGRTAKFGGTSILVTLIFLLALIGIYSVVNAQNWKVDLTQTNQFTLNDEGKAAIAGIGADPSVPKLKIVAFFGANQASTRDQDTVLFDNYQSVSNGKITYEFVDPDRNPQIADQYKATRGGQAAVVRLGEDGTPDYDHAELVTTPNQDSITNAILKVAANGDFRAYFMTVTDGATLADSGDTGISTVNTTLTTRYDWKTQQVSFVDITKPDSTIHLNDANADAEVMVIVGGSHALSDQELQVVTDFVNKGGKLVIFAGSSLNSDNTALALDPKLSDFLFNNFGMKFENNVVMDSSQAFQTPMLPVATDLDNGSFITSNLPAQSKAIIFELPHSITIDSTLPTNVSVTELARTSETSYASTDFAAVKAGNITKTDADPAGPFVLAASAENSQTGARVVLFGSESPILNAYAQFNGIGNLGVAFNSLVWATHFNDFFKQINVTPPQHPQDTPIYADAQETRNINFITIVIMPFGVLAIGILVWWLNREREHAH
jgi:gliding motility-associatede transport system auxiliary component